MAYKALYREYRPQTFSEVVGQKAIVETLKNSIVNNRIAHAYLFTGPRGTGKTSIAKIFAKAINCDNFHKEPCNDCHNCIEITEGSHPDVIEMDAASNNSVDNVRDIIERVKYSPLEGKYKVYIIDEAHMLSNGAFNALLKTLEEPPEHVIFIFATTEPLKVPPTIISRCQRYDFGRIDDIDIYNHLKEVVKKEKIKADDIALKTIARLSVGGMRDALSILDQCVSYAGNNITEESVSEVYGLVSTKDMVSFLLNLHHKNTDIAFKKISEFIAKGMDIRRTTEDMLNICKEVAVYQSINSDQNLVRLNKAEADEISKCYSVKDCIRVVDLCLDALAKYRTSENANSYFEVLVLKIMDEVGIQQESIDEVKEVKEVKEEPIVSLKIDDSGKETVEEATIKEEVEVATVEEPKIVEEATVEEIEDNKDEKVEGKSNPVDEIKDVLLNLGAKPEDLVIEDDDVSRETIIEDYEVDNEVLLEILVRANKETKAKDQNGWLTIPAYKADFDYGKFAGLLSGSQIIASCDDSIIVSVLTKGVANDINAAADDDSISEFIQLILKEDKYIIALTKEEANDLIQLFRTRQQEGTLPTGNGIVKKEKEKEEVKTETMVDRMNELFGEGNFDLIEGDQDN